MNDRKDLHAVLKDICPNVYFQPPESIKLVYPCIVYSFGRLNNRRADNRNYKTCFAYTVTYITRDPVDKTPLAINDIPESSFDRYFVSDNLYHHVFTVTI